MESKRDDSPASTKASASSPATSKPNFMILNWAADKAVSNHQNNADRYAIAVRKTNNGVISARNGGIHAGKSKKVALTHQLFTLSLLEYICDQLNVKDKQSAELQFQGK